MRKLVIASTIALTLASVFLVRNAAGKRPHINISPFADTYEIQQQTGIDFGFNEDKKFPGFGGRNSHTDVVLAALDVRIECQDAILKVIANRGLATSIDIVCPVADHSDFDLAASQTQKLIKRFTESPEWDLRKNLMLERSKENIFGESVFSAFNYLATQSNQNFGVERVPLLSWTSGTADGYAELSAVVHWRDGDDRLRYELKTSFDSDCLLDIANYEGASKRGELDQDQYQKIASLREYFSNRVYTDIPWKERVALTHRYVTETCKNTK
ncbi:hypothetical protein [Thalassospira sp. TSL5-1]|uniref:hypothetical protein n=1 Tax=Thalassospira sp. TSL5-1 TaxID=1544451 RepID=UPI000AD9B73C|nr:hypothetical protein [Thalassospira sp. TSL5-1]